MKGILKFLLKTFAFFAVVSLVGAGCVFVSESIGEPVEHYEMENTISLSLNVVEKLEEDIKSNLIYNWDESKYGKLSYTRPDSFRGVLVHDGAVVDESTYYVGGYHDLNVSLDEEYDMLLYSTGDVNETVFTDGTFISQYKETESPEYSEGLRKRSNCDEIFAIYGKDIMGGFDPRHAKIIMIDDKPVYLYHLNFETEPITYVYIIQVIIYDDDPNIPMTVATCDYIGIGGFTDGVNMVDRESAGGRCLVESTNVKPIQPNPRYGVCAERFVTYGHYEDGNSSWGSTGIKYECMVAFTLANGIKCSGRINITKALDEKPHGGIINVLVNNSDIAGGVDSDDDGIFEIDINDWSTTIIDINF